MSWPVKIALIFLAVPVCIAGFYMLKLMAAKRLALKDEMDSEHGFVSNNPHEELIGRFATAQTVLRPGGMIVISGKRLDARADGEFIEKGQTVRVIGVDGAQLVVEHANE